MPARWTVKNSKRLIPQGVGRLYLIIKIHNLYPMRHTSVNGKIFIYAFPF